MSAQEQAADLEVSVWLSRGRSCLAVRGEIDLLTGSQFAAVLDAVIDVVVARDHCELVVDFAGVTFVDVQGVRTLVVAAERMGSRGRLLLVSPSGIVQRVLVLTGFDHLIDVQTESPSHPDRPDPTDSNPDALLA